MHSCQTWKRLFVRCTTLVELADTSTNKIECFQSQIHYTCWIAYFLRTLHQNTVACDVIMVARQRTTCVYSNINNGKEREHALLCDNYRITFASDDSPGRYCRPSDYRTFPTSSQPLRHVEISKGLPVINTNLEFIRIVSFHDVVHFVRLEHSQSYNNNTVQT